MTQYDVTPDADGCFRVERRGTLTAGVGTAGRLIPPVDYHVIANALPKLMPDLTPSCMGASLCS